MFNLWKRKASVGLSTSTLFDEKNFYQAFVKDLESCEKEVIIESPYITASRMELMYPLFSRLLEKGVKINIITRDPIDHEDEYMRYQATNEILRCAELGVKIITLNGFHHRKIAIIDRNILWEGSLNILSQVKSRELMRRINGKEIALQMFKFLKLGELL